MKIIAIGRNYINHAKELKNPIPEAPIFFMKPDTSLVNNNKPFFYPNFSKNIHYELELVIKINRVGRYIDEKFAKRYYNEIGLGIDFTARDLQDKCKKNGLPWEMAKAFDNSAPVSKFIDISNFPDINNLNFTMSKNGNEVQNGNSKNMIFSFDKLISYVSQFITLKIGDLIFTGTPAGVGAVNIGDKLEGFLENEKIIVCDIK